MQTVAPKTWYVYTYAYPDGTVFYVGKGCQGRIDRHEQTAEAGCMCKKCEVIRSIWESGNPVQKRIVFETLVESEAFEREKHFIALYWSEQLANLRSIPHDKPVKEERLIKVPVMRELRKQAGLTPDQLASEARVSLSTVNRMEYGTTQVTRRIAYQVLNVISSKIGRRITIEEVEGLQVKT